MTHDTHDIDTGSIVGDHHQYRSSCRPHRGEPVMPAKQVMEMTVQIQSLREAHEEGGETEHFDRMGEILSTSDMSDLRSYFMREVGEAHVDDDGREHPNIRTAMQHKISQPLEEKGVPVYFGTKSHYSAVRLFGLPMDGGWVPFAVATGASQPGGPLEEMFHAYLHRVDWVWNKQAEGMPMVDGGEDEEAEGADKPVVESSEKDFPPALKDTERWGPWLLHEDGRKIPRAPHRGSKERFADATDPENWHEYDRMVRWVNMVDEDFGLRFTLTSDDNYTLMDFDDVRDPETGEVHPKVVEYLDRVGGFAQVSTSGTGVHMIVEGDLPAGMNSLVFELPGDGPAELEIYPGERFIAMTGDILDRAEACVADAQDLLDDLVDEYGSERAERATVERGDEWEPDISREEVQDIDSTHNMDDILAAIRHTDVGDIRLRSAHTEGDRGSRMSFDPSWESSDSGTRLGYEDGGFIYRKGNVGLDALQVVALEERIINNVNEYPSGDDFWEAVEALRDRGGHIPEYESGGAADTAVAALPTTPAAKEWDWRSAAGISPSDDPISLEEARGRVEDIWDETITEGRDVLMNALPGLGKSSGGIRAAARTGENVSIYTARHDLYQQYADWCDENGLDYKILPSMPRDCPTATGEFGEDWATLVNGWYNHGATPKTIHAQAEAAIGEDLPCHHDGQCPYTARWDFEPDEYDVIIGHYSHAYKENTHSGRVAVFDEFPGEAFQTQLRGDAFKEAVDSYLDRNADLPFDSYGHLVTERNNDELVEEAMAHFEGGVESEEFAVMLDDNAHADAPLAVYALLTASDLGNGMERTRMRGGQQAVVDKSNLSVNLLQSPDLQYASGVVALDGTPTKQMWETVLGEQLREEQPLTTEERQEYIRRVAGLNFVQTTDHIKPYSSGNYVTDGAVQKDMALFEEIDDQYEQSPALISTLSANRTYEEAGVDAVVDEKLHYGNLKGSNALAEKRLGVVSGSRHYGDRYIKRWGAFSGTAVEPNGERGEDRSYGEYGDEVLTHMREHETLQAALRFGRDGNGATVFVHTSTLPDWVPLAGRGASISVWSDGMEQVMEALKNRERWTSKHVAEQCDISKRQVHEHLKTLSERGYVTVKQDGQAFVWSDDRLEYVGEHGEVSFSDLDLGELAPADEHEVSRNTVFTWDFTPSGSTSAPTGPGTDRGPVEARADGGDPPSGEGDPPE